MTTTAKKLKSGKYVFLIMLLCSVAYMVSYLTRYNYAAALVVIEDLPGFNEANASYPLTAMFIVYGSVQLLSGYLGDKIAPEKIVCTGLLGTCILNLIIPLCASPVMMTVIWGLNGIAQSLMWPPIVKILTDNCTKDDYGKYIVYVMFGTGLGTIIVYSGAPAILKIWNWTGIFIIPAVIAAVMALIWVIAYKKIVSHAEEVEIYVPETAKKDAGKVKFTSAAILLLVFIMLANIMQGLLRDGSATYMPKYMKDVFAFDASLAILTGIALPLGSKVVSLFTSIIHRRILKNEASTTTLFFFIMTLCFGTLFIAENYNPWLSIVLFTIANASSHAINFMYTTIAVPHFERFGKASFIAGLINSSVYIGSALTTWCTPFMVTNFGWTGVMLTWLITSALGLIVCVISIKPFSKPL